MYDFLPYLAVMRLHRYALDARRKERTWRYLGWSVVVGVTAGVLLATATFLTWFLLYVDLWWIAIPFAGLVAVRVLAPLMVRHAITGLGWTRVAYWTAHAEAVRDPVGYALCAAAWAHAHRPDPAGEAWIVARRDKRQPLGDAEVVVTALLVAARGDADTARLLLRSTPELVEVHPRVREIAGEWLACDAAERHAWRELHDDAMAARFPATPLSYFLEGIAARRVGASAAPSRAELVSRWLLAPNRRHTRALLDDVPVPRAPIQTDQPDAPVTAAPAAADAPPLPAAVAAHLALDAAPASTDGLARVARAWDAALADPTLRIWIARRAIELEAPAGAVDRALGDVARQITDDLARIANDAMIGLGAPPSTGPISDALARRLRHGRLDALESGFQRWAERKRANERHPPIDEWREYVALRAAYDAAAAAGGLELRRFAFPHAYGAGNTIAVWLWNERKEYAMSHAISTWLLREAIAVGDAQAIDLCTQNTRLAVPTRTGRVLPS